MKKALLALLLFSAFMFVLPAASDAAIQQDTDGYYLLATSSDLKEFKELVDSGYLIAKGKLTNDIVLSSDKAPCDWTEVGPIGPSSSREFLGVFDGQGYAIKGYYVKDTTKKFNGFIGRLGTSGIVKNLTISGMVETGAVTVGVFVGSNYGKIANCTNMASLTTTGTIAGGIAGQNYSDGDNVSVIINCLNYKTVTGSNAVGGILGALSANCRVENCVNTGRIFSPSGAGSGLGGIAGNTFGGVIKNCVNTGEVSGIPLAKTQWGTSPCDKNVGGIAGSSSSAISNCVSIGNVTIAPLISDDTDYRVSQYIGAVAGKSTGTVENCSWFKDSAIFPEHGIGGAGSYGTGSDEGTTSRDKKEKLPVSAILLDSYVKTGHTFELTATAYPAESEQAAALAVTAAEGLKLTPPPAELKSGEKTTFTVTEGTAGTEYKAEVSAGDASAAFTVIPVDAPVTPTPEPDPTPSGSSSSGGCSAGFGALALLALLPLALRRRG
ncbi:GLUG motif-containing protein [Cloacibacillus evryensis]|uniref:GLUG motif-containing protein n=1 Tax=Cloacibacillus evryensis TaxID=508460 RepID=UPI00210D0063|nr:GLUG motif-containing protein [Cloacibacillus evryensis]MCQ4765337.1 SYNERG-CTERM sorting domain-containing protein [Cloacibacillus evryensis]